MPKKPEKNLLVGLDIGTSKVVAIVGDINAEGNLEIIGIGSHPSRGLKRGVVVNIEATVQSIDRAIEEAELMAGCQIHSAFTGIAGSHIRSLNSHGIVAIRDTEVAQGDVDRVLMQLVLWQFLPIKKYSMSCLKNLLLIIKKVYVNRLVCPVCD